MKKLKRALVLGLVLCLMLAMTACNPYTYAESDQIILDAADLAGYIGKEGVVIIDMQDEEGYAGGHVPGAVNLQMSSVTVNLPVDNMLAPMSKIATAIGEAGIDNGTQVVIYDEGKMLKSSRLWWTLLVAGHDNVKVVNGGFTAIEKAGVELTTERPTPAAKTFTPNDRTAEYVAAMKDIKAQVEDPQPGVVLLDTRSDAEYLEAGKIPGSIMYDYTNNFYSDGTLIDRQAARINYLEQGVTPDEEVIMYCQTSMRAAVTFLRLYDAGYRNMKIYDGAYMEWSASGNNPVEMPDNASPVDVGGRNSS